MHKKLCPFFLFVFLTFTHTISAQNILENGGFEDGQGDWSTYFGSGYSGSLSIINSNTHSGLKAARVHISQVPSSPAVLDVQLKNNSFHIDSGHAYHLTIWMKADQAVDVQIILVQNTSPWAWLKAENVTLGTTYQMYSLYVNSALFTTSDDVRFAVRCGNSPAYIFIDDVAITDCTKPTGYESLQTSISGEGTVSIESSMGINKCLDECTNNYENGETLSLTQSAQPGYSFSGWSGACSGTGVCNINMSQVQHVEAHFNKTSTYSECIDYRNQIDWSNVGYVGTIPYPENTINMTDTPYSCSGNGVYNNHDALKAALIDAKTNTGWTVLYFPPGNYFFNTPEQLNIYDSTIIRGACVGSTTFTIGNSSSDTFDFLKAKGGSTVDSSKLLGGYNFGSKILSIADTTKFDVYDFIEIFQENDPVKMYTDPDSALKAGSGLTYNKQSVGEIAQIIAKHKNTIVLDREIHHTFDPKLRPSARKITPIKNIGVENLKINNSGGAEIRNIHFHKVYNSWVRNIEGAYTSKAHIVIRQSYRIEVRDNYLHHSYNYGGGGHGYGIDLRNRSTSCLIEHNVFNRLRHAMVLSTGANGNVLGYNYSRDNRDDSQSNITYYKADISLHGFFSYMNLFEGNIVQAIESADWWGPSGPGNTFFRNRVESKPLIVDDHSHYQNVIGNELLNTFAYAGDIVIGFILGPSFNSNIEINSDVENTNQHSNNDRGLIDNNKISTLPNSLYRSDPNFNYGSPIPTIGPVSTLTNDPYPIEQHDNKAKDRYDSGNYVECLNPCNINIDSLSFVCDSSMYIQLEPNASTTKLYGITITSITSNYNDFEPTEGDPELYFVLKENGTIIYTSSTASSSMPDVYIPCSPQTISNNNYAVLIYDDDVSNDDLLGTVSFSGNSNGSFFYTNYSGEVLGIYLNKTKYDRLYSWSTGSTNNYETFTQNGAYSVTVTDIQGCEREKKFHVCWPCTYTESWPNNLSLSNTLSGQEYHHARIKLEAENIIQSGANVQYKSAGEVLLKPGFHSQNNSQFRAYIIDCGD
ncbi:MAG TPA: hypothetical protein EYQ86_06220 [Bacteroidetes bacterium]|nr:hypothetical protein [Bacteroidota bacterium]